MPAITAALAALPGDAVVRVVLEVEDAGHEPPLTLPAGAELVVVHRANGGAADALLAAVRDLDLA